MQQFVIIIIGLIMLLCATTTKAQNVVLEGNTFIQKVDSTANLSNATSTGYTYRVEKTNEEFPVFLSSNKKAFVIRTSKKTGKKYRQYLPQITEQLTTSK